MKGIPHLPALDGLRGLAVLGVLFFHANGALRGGYLGVDLFFVLSGYLITSILLAEHRAAGKIALKNFWIRRARRLFPALLSLMPAIALYCWLFAKPDELSRVRGDALATLGYIANWRSIFSEKSYWELFATPSPLEHTWSLSIEEQFYVVWPLVVMVVLRRGSKKTLLLLSVALAIASIVTMLVLFHPARTSRVYFGTDTRAVGILAGAALACLLPPTTTFARASVKKLDVLGVLSAIGLAIAWWTIGGESRFLYRGGFWLTELAALVLIACAVADKESLVARALSFRPLTWVGTISYGLYLWHWPVNVVLSPQRLHFGGFRLHVIQFALAFAIAIVSYRFLEKPIRTRGLPFGRPIYIVPAAVVFAVLLVVRATWARPLPAQQPGQVVDFSLDTNVEDPSTKVLLLGDSTANSLGWILRGARRPGVAVDIKGRDGCTMLWDTCLGDQWAKMTTELHSDITIVFIGGAFMHGLSTETDWVKACHPEWDAKYQKVLSTHLAELVVLPTKVWVATVPYGLNAWDDKDLHREIDCINEDTRKAAAAVPAVRVLELADRVCSKQHCDRDENNRVRPDGVHYDIDGAQPVARWIFDQITRP